MITAFAKELTAFAKECDSAARRSQGGGGLENLTTKRKYLAKTVSRYAIGLDAHVGAQEAQAVVAGAGAEESRHRSAAGTAPANGSGNGNGTGNGGAGTGAGGGQGGVEADGGTKRTLSYLWRLLTARGIDVAKIQDDIKTLIIKSLVCAEEEIEYQGNSFEVFGYDVLIDTDLVPWLIEVSSPPPAPSS